MIKNKIIADLERQIYELKQAAEKKDNEIAALKSKLSGERCCTHLCKHCEHAIAISSWNAFVGAYTDYLCE